MKEKILEYANNKFGKITNFLIAGSYLTENFNKYSDIDIVLFQNKIRQGQNHTVLIENMKVQFVVIPLSNLSTIFYDDYKSHRGSFCHMVANSIVAFENNQSEFLKEIIDHAILLLNTPRNNRSEVDIYQLRYIITNQIMDLKAARTNDEMIFTVFELIHHLSSLKMLFEGYFITGGGRHKYRALLKDMPDFMLQIETTTKEYFQNSDLKPLIKFSEKILKLCGGELVLYTKSKILTEVHNDILLLSLSEDEYSKNNNLIKNFLYTAKLKDKFNIFLRDKLVYIEIKFPKEHINNVLLKKTESLCYNHKLNIDFPLRMDLEFEFSQIKNYYRYIDILNQIQSKISIWLNENNAFSIFYSFIQDFRPLFKSNKSFNKFLKTLLNDLLPFYYDDGNISSSKVLLTKKENAEIYFNETFIKNQNEYTLLYKNSREGIFSSDILEVKQVLKKEINSLIAITNRRNSMNFFFIYRFLSMLMIEDQYKSFLVYTFINLNQQNNA